MNGKMEPEVGSTDEFVNYMPAMPNVSGESGRLRRLFRGLLRRIV